jgi:hypothetical protein
MVEFLHDLIFGVNHPGLALALDPITIALITQGITKGVQGITQANRGKKTQEEGRDLFDKQVEDFRSGKYDLTLGQGVYDAYTNTQRLAEEAAQKTGEAGRSAISSAIANTRYGDPRTAFLTPKTAQTAMGAMADANVKAAQQQAEATMGLATTEQGIKTANETMRQQMESMLMARGAGQEQQGLQQRAEGANTAIGGFGDATGAFAAEQFGDPTSTFFDNSPYGKFMGLNGKDGMRVPNYVLGGMLDQIGGTMGDSLMEGIGRRRAAKGKDTRMFGYQAQDFDQEGNLVNDDSDDITITVSKNGEVQRMQQGGVAPEILPGEFDHDSNPIHMVDDNGNKVAEATGGEILFNQTQSNNLIKLLQSGDPEALYAYLAELMQSPQFQMEVEEYNSELNG